jgi:hypothetical protein
MHADGGGLYLQVTTGGASWIYRLPSGKPRLRRTRIRSIGALPVQAIDTVLVMKVFEQEVDRSIGSLWNARPETVR